MSEKIHIAFVIDAWLPFWGGGQTHLKHLKATLQKNHQVSSLIFYPPHPHFFIRFIWTFILPFQILISHFLNKPFKLVHSHGYLSGLTAKISSLLLNIPVIHTVHGSNSLDLNRADLKAKIERWLLTKIHYHAQITVSSTFLEHPNVNLNTNFIPNGVNLADFDQINVSKSKHPTIIWVGRQTEPLKAYDLLQTAFTKLKSIHPNLQLNAVTNNRLSGKQLIKAYKQAHLFVLPSLSEGQPITLLEAWAAKLPVIVTRVGENPNMVIHRKNGLLTDPGNLEQLITSIDYLLTHPKAAQQMSIQGYQLVQTKYTWDKITAKTFKVYQQVLKSSK